MATRKQKSQPVKKSQAPLDENPLAKPEISRKDIAIKKKQNSKTMKDDDWKI